MSEEKEQIGFLVSKQYADQFREMAKDDRRNLSAQFELFVEREWERRHPDPVTIQNKIGKRILGVGSSAEKPDTREGAGLAGNIGA